MKLDPYLIALTNINQNGLETNIRTDTLKLLEGNIEKKCLNIGLGNDCFGYDPKSISNKGKKSVSGSTST